VVVFGLRCGICDDEDGYLALALVEHWRHVLLGAAHWTDPIFFFPQRGRARLHGRVFLLASSTLRCVLPASMRSRPLMLVMAATSAIGFFGFRRLAVRHFEIPPACAAVGAFLFAFANMDAVKLIHIQALRRMLLPSISSLILAGWNGKRRGAVFGGAAGLLYAALFLTAFQTAWFFGFLLLLLALLHPVICGPWQSSELVRQMMTSRRPMIVAAALAFAAGILPFLILYVPVILAGHSRDFAEVASNMPEWSDLANVTPENVIWGSTLERLGIAGQADDPVWEAELGLTPTVIVVFIVGLAILAAQMRAPPYPLPSAALPSPARGGALGRGAGEGAADRLLLMLGAAVIILWLLQMDYFGTRPWRAVWAASTGREGHSLHVPLTTRGELVRRACDSPRFGGNCPRSRLGMAVVCRPDRGANQSGLACRHVAPRRPRVDRRRAAATAGVVPDFLRDATRSSTRPDRTAAPGRCHVVGRDQKNSHYQWLFELVSRRWALDDPSGPNYAGAVRSWADRNGIADGLCGLEPRAGTWTPGLPN